MTEKFQSFCRNDKGGVLVLVSILLVPITLVVGLAIDTSVGFENKRRLQMACDAAAKAGATNGNLVLSTTTSEAQRIFTANTQGMSGITGPNITVDIPTNTVTVSASVKVLNTFMALGGIPTSTYNASATFNAPLFVGCMYAMNPSANSAILLSGGSSITMAGCGVYANSSSSSAVNLSGGSSSLTAQFARIVGNYATSGGATFTAAGGIVTGYPSFSSPLGVIPIPPYSSCTYNTFSVSGTQTLNPGVYCNGLALNSGANVTLNPGVYIVDGGTLNISSAQLTGNGVTIILTRKLSSSYATLNISGGSAAVTLTPPTGNSSNPFNGVVIYQDPNAPSGITNKIQGGTAININGVISLPKQNLSFSGGSTNSSPCTILIADKISFSGGSNISCSNSLLKQYITGFR